MCFDSKPMKEETLTTYCFQPRTQMGKDPSLTLTLLLFPLLKPQFDRASKAKTTSHCNRTEQSHSNCTFEVAIPHTQGIITVKFFDGE